MSELGQTQTLTSITGTSAVGGILLQNSILLVIAISASARSGHYPVPLPAGAVAGFLLFGLCFWVSRTTSGGIEGWRRSTGISRQLAKVLCGGGEQNFVAGASEAP